MTSPDSLFPSTDKGSSSGWIAMNDMDVRMCLATGVVQRARDTRPFAPDVNPPAKGWRWIDPETLDRAIPVRDPKRACLIRLRGLEFDGNFLDEPVPASMIAEIAFPSRQAGEDWVARSSTFDGLPGSLPTPTAIPSLMFEEADTEQQLKSEQSVRSSPTESDRVAGVFTTMLAEGGASADSVESLAEASMPGRDRLLDVLHQSLDVRRESLALCLEILAEPRWTDGFDPLELLEAMRDGLSETIAAERVEGWAAYVGDVLRNLRDAGPDTLLDAGNILLRALQLVLRTAPLSVREINHQIEARGRAVGTQVGQLARLLAAWYEGFGALTGVAKTRPEMYSIGSRIAAHSEHFPLRFSVERSPDRTGFGRSVRLLEDGKTVVDIVERPSAEFMEAYYATETVCESKGWSLAPTGGADTMRITVDDRLIEARLVSDGEICWHAKMVAAKRPRARTWPKGFVDRVLEVATDCKCVISSPNGYPDLEFKSYQLLGTMDRTELGFHIQAISSAMERMDRLSAEVLEEN